MTAVKDVVVRLSYFDSSDEDDCCGIVDLKLKKAPLVVERKEKEEEKEKKEEQEKQEVEVEDVRNKRKREEADLDDDKNTVDRTCVDEDGDDVVDDVVEKEKEQEPMPLIRTTLAIMNNDDDVVAYVDVLFTHLLFFSDAAPLVVVCNVRPSRSVQKKKKSKQNGEATQQRQPPSNISLGSHLLLLPDGDILLLSRGPSLNPGFFISSSTPSQISFFASSNALTGLSWYDHTTDGGSYMDIFNQNFAYLSYFADSYDIVNFWSSHFEKLQKAIKSI